MITDYGNGETELLLLVYEQVVVLVEALAHHPVPLRGTCSGQYQSSEFFYGAFSHGTFTEGLPFSRRMHAGRPTALHGPVVALLPPSSYSALFH